jgi:hypothetical protein
MDDLRHSQPEIPLVRRGRRRILGTTAENHPILDGIAGFSGFEILSILFILSELRDAAHPPGMLSRTTVKRIHTNLN